MAQEKSPLQEGLIELLSVMSIPLDGAIVRVQTVILYFDIGES